MGCTTPLRYVQEKKLSLGREEEREEMEGTDQGGVTGGNVL